MSHRSIKRNPISARKDQYTALEQSGEQQEAIMDAFEALSVQGFDLGVKMQAILQKRAGIKRRNPK
jgi:hypothetical protein